MGQRSGQAAEQHLCQLPNAGNASEGRDHRPVRGSNESHIGRDLGKGQDLSGV